MALWTEAGTFNTAVDALIVDYGAAIAALTGPLTIGHVFCDVERGVAAATAPTFTPGVKEYKRTIGVGSEAADNIWAVPGWHVAKALGFTPLFFKLTNAAGES